MKRMSFAETPDQILAQTKTVTRRTAWKDAKPGDLIQPVEKAMGLQKGEKQRLLGPPILIRAVSFEPANRIIDPNQDREAMMTEVFREGFPEETPEDFWQRLIRLNPHLARHPETEITVLTFSYLNLYRVSGSEDEIERQVLATGPLWAFNKVNRSSHYQPEAVRDDTAANLDRIRDHLEKHASSYNLTHYCAGILL